ncbi:CPBP family intramembrane glutamic endopeptidase [Aquibacillus rhizosphaerae]|uniref:CPBP family intramembrane metalloprotease n=1 Tax=Aquibacillus rhizosphaerae TaxID=3051431 RepID=A0ABT7L5T8_9BACI|nr:CPBP family intramembrane glutamic endopeptidase [Aquibacillus sp. LR5S19]MDL4840769.1 CPBP family intramembrane metalloprotease [Aquibacillus sp. LR5S19]
MKNKQAELIKRMSSNQLKQQVYLSQLLILVVGIVFSFIVFESITDWVKLFEINSSQWLYYGVIPGFIVVLVDLLLMTLLPKSYLDDGGINEKLFKNCSFVEIFVIALLVSISEEVLFRGVVQTSFGYIPASLLFALIHIRYLSKPILLCSIVVLSFYLGYMFEVTHNLFVTIIAHFIIDFTLALIIRFRSKGDSNVRG